MCARDIIHENMTERSANVDRVFSFCFSSFYFDFTAQDAFDGETSGF